MYMCVDRCVVACTCASMHSRAMPLVVMEINDAKVRPSHQLISNRYREGWALCVVDSRPSRMRT